MFILLQDMVENVSDVRLLHDDVSVGMKDLKSFMSERITLVSSMALVFSNYIRFVTC
jgi:hypothetical protein